MSGAHSKFVRDVVRELGPLGWTLVPTRGARGTGERELPSLRGGHRYLVHPVAGYLEIQGGSTEPGPRGMANVVAQGRRRARHAKSNVGAFLEYLLVREGVRDDEVAVRTFSLLGEAEHWCEMKGLRTPPRNIAEAAAKSPLIKQLQNLGRRGGMYELRGPLYLEGVVAHEPATETAAALRDLDQITDEARDYAATKLAEPAPEPAEEAPAESAELEAPAEPAEPAAADTVAPAEAAEPAEPAAGIVLDAATSDALRRMLLPTLTRERGLINDRLELAQVALSGMSRELAELDSFIRTVQEATTAIARTVRDTLELIQLDEHA